MRIIFETAIYCGRLKEWRILNLNTATVYTMGYDSEDEAFAAIEDGEQRAGSVVRAIPLREIRERLL